MNKEKSIDILNTLIQINNDRIAGYKKAVKETEEPELKDLFNQFQQTSQKCKAELIEEVCKLGGKPVEKARMNGKFFSLWMDIKSSKIVKDGKAIINRKSIINSLGNWRSGFAIETYNDILSNNLKDMSSEQYSMINAQHAMINADHYQMISQNRSRVQMVG